MKMSPLNQCVILRNNIILKACENIFEGGLKPLGKKNNSKTAVNVVTLFSVVL